MRALNFFVLVTIEIGLISLRISQPLGNENALKFRSGLEPISGSHLTLARDQTQDVMMKSESGENFNREMERDDNLSREVKTTGTTKENFNEPLSINPNKDPKLLISEQEKILIQESLNSAEKYHNNPIIRLKKIFRSYLFKNPLGSKNQSAGEETFKDEKVVLSDQKAQKDRDIQPREDEMKTEEMNPDGKFKEPENASVKESKPPKQRKISLWEAIRKALTPNLYLFNLLKKMWANWFKHFSGQKNKPKSRPKKIPVTKMVFKNEQIQKFDHRNEERRFENLSPSDLKEVKVEENSKDENFHSSESTRNIKTPPSEEAKQEFQSNPVSSLDSKELVREEEIGPALQFFRNKSPRNDDDLNQEEGDELIPSNNIQFLPPSPSFSMSSKDFKSMIQSKEFHPYTTSPNFESFIHSTEIHSDVTTPKFEHIQPVSHSPEVLSEPLSLEDTYELIHPTGSDPESITQTLEKTKSQNQFSEIIPVTISPREEPNIDSPESLSSPQEYRDKIFEPAYKDYKGEWDYLKIRKPAEPIQSTSTSSPSLINLKHSRQTSLKNSLRRNYSKKQFLMKSSKQLKVLKKSKSQKFNQVLNSNLINQPTSTDIIDEPKPKVPKPWMYERIFSWFE